MDKIGKMPNIFGQKTNTSKHLFSAILHDHIILNLKGKTKETIINELLDMLVTQGKLLDRDTALKDLLAREQTMSTAIPNGIGVPHTKTAVVQKLTIFTHKPSRNRARCFSGNASRISAI
jgi:mannitol/fructose-specific phosphotransferase system IIA component (Ntr-type)